MVEEMALLSAVKVFAMTPRIKNGSLKSTPSGCVFVLCANSTQALFGPSIMWHTLITSLKQMHQSKVLTAGFQTYASSAIFWWLGLEVALSTCKTGKKGRLVIKFGTKWPFTWNLALFSPRWSNVYITLKVINVIINYIMLSNMTCNFKVLQYETCMWSRRPLKINT